MTRAVSATCKHGGAPNTQEAAAPPSTTSTSDISDYFSGYNEDNWTDNLIPPPVYTARGQAGRPICPQVLHLSDLELHDKALDGHGIEKNGLDYPNRTEEKKVACQPIFTRAPSRGRSPRTGTQVGLVHAELLPPTAGHQSIADMCAACHFFLGSTKGVRAMQKMYHPECFCCAVCEKALFVADVSAKEDELTADSERERVSFFSVGGLPLCRQHFLEAWEEGGDGEDGEEEEEEEEHEQQQEEEQQQLEEEEEEEEEKQEVNKNVQEMARGKTKQWSISLCETALCETALEDNPDQTRVGALDAEGSKQAGSRPSSPALGSEDSFLTAPTITDRGLFSTLQDEDTCALAGTATSRRGVPTLDGGSVYWASLSTPSASASSSLPNAHACPDAPFAADVPSTPVVSVVVYPRKLPEGDLSAGAGEAGLLSPGRGLEETANKPLFGIPVPSSTCAMRRCRSAATLRQHQRHPSPRSSPREPAPWEGKGGEEGEGGRGGRQRRHRRVESILSFVAEESAEERNARMCRSRQRSNPCLVYQVRDWSGGPLGARKEGGKEGGKEEGEGMGGGGRGEDVGRKTGGREKDPGLPLGLVQDPLLSQEASPARLPPLTISRALSYGLQVAMDRAGSWSLHKGETVGARGSAREGLKDDIFQARVQLELIYGGTLPSTSTFSHPPSLYYWEEAAPEVFQQVRAAFGVEEDAYRQSLMSILDGKEDLVPSPITVAGPTTRKDQTGNVRNGKGSGKFTDTLEASESARAVSKPPAGPKGPAFPRMGWASPTPRREPFGQGGKSGSLFFKSQDEAFLLKTTSDAEHALLLSLLHDYLQVILTRGPHSLLPRFLGLYTVKLPGRPACKLLCMKNIFHRAVPALRLLEKFDLKGSLIKRRVLPTLSPRVRRFSVLKDLNFCPRHDGTDDAGHPFRGASCSKGIGGEAGTEGGCRRLRLGVERKKQLLSYLAADVEWLRRRGIMDYSLLVGVGRISELATNHRWGGKDGGENPPPISVMEALRATAPDEASRQHLYNLWLPSIPPAAVSPPYASDVLRESGVSLTGQGTPRTTPPLSPSLGNGSRNAGPKSVNSFFSFLTSPSVATSAPTPILTKSSPSSSSIFRTQEVFLLGLVDILQTYTVKRRLETLIKGAAYTMEGHDPRNISVVEPDAFAERFLDFIDRHTI